MRQDCCAHTQREYKTHQVFQPINASNLFTVATFSVSKNYAHRFVRVWRAWLFSDVPSTAVNRSVSSPMNCPRHLVGMTEENHYINRSGSPTCGADWRAQRSVPILRLREVSFSKFGPQPRYFRGFPQPLQASDEIKPYIRSWQFPSISFRIHHSRLNLLLRGS